MWELHVKIRYTPSSLETDQVPVTPLLASYCPQCFIRELNTDRTSQRSVPRLHRASRHSLMVVHERDRV